MSVTNLYKFILKSPVLNIYTHFNNIQVLVSFRTKEFKSGFKPSVYVRWKSLSSGKNPQVNSHDTKLYG